MNTTLWSDKFSIFGTWTPHRPGSRTEHATAIAPCCCKKKNGLGFILCYQQRGPVFSSWKERCKISKNNPNNTIYYTTSVNLEPVRIITKNICFTTNPHLKHISVCCFFQMSFPDGKSHRKHQHIATNKNKRSWLVNLPPLAHPLPEKLALWSGLINHC